MNDIDNYESNIRIVVIGVGGAGNNAVNRMLEDEYSSVEFYVMNTDKQSLHGSKVPSSNRIVLGDGVTEGLGAGGDPEIGRKAAEASGEEIRNIVRGANMVFIAAGLGGGTGTGAVPVIANICREEKALTLSIVTLPFGFEGKKRGNNSVNGYKNLKVASDAIVLVSNDKLLMNKGYDLISKAFLEADKVLAQCVKTVIDLIINPGVINLDFADVRATLEKSGIALIGFGTANGPNKAVDAANMAINSQLQETSIAGARRAICSVTCGPEVTLYEAQECVRCITEAAGGELDVKLGVAINEQLSDEIMVSVIASDFATEINPFNESSNEKKIRKTEKEEIRNEIDVNKDKKETVKEDDDILPNFLKSKNIY